MYVFAAVSLCFVAGIHATVILTPSTLNVCPQQDTQVVAFTCMTNGTGALLWIQGSQQHFYTSTSMVGDTGSLGHFTTRLDSAEGLNLTSTATTNVSSLLNSNISNNITIKCDDNGDTIGAESAVLTISGPPPAPNVSFITPSQTSSSLLISWNMSDCAVQYVVTIINSSDGSVYLNITTSDTNTTVTLPTSVEYCVTVLGVDSINRTGSPSQQQCYIWQLVATSSTYLSIPSFTTTSQVRLSTVEPTGSFSSTTSPAGPTDLPVNAVAIAVPIVLILILLLLIVTVIIAILLLVRRRGRSKMLTLEMENHNDSPNLHNLAQNKLIDDDEMEEGTAPVPSAVNPGLTSSLYISHNIYDEVDNESVNTTDGVGNKAFTKNEHSKEQDDKSEDGLFVDAEEKTAAELLEESIMGHEEALKNLEFAMDYNNSF